MQIIFIHEAKPCHLSAKNIHLVTLSFYYRQSL